MLDDIAALSDPKVPRVPWLEAVRSPGAYKKGEIPYSRFIKPKASEYADLSLDTCQQMFGTGKLYPDLP